MNVRTARRIAFLNPSTDEVVISELVEAARTLARELDRVTRLLPENKRPTADDEDA